MAKTRRSSCAFIAVRRSTAQLFLQTCRHWTKNTNKRASEKIIAAQFELGDPEHPRGHALVYFRVSSSSDELLATYVVVLPIAINPAKYIPPAFAARMPAAVQSVDATALPPIPESAGDLTTLRRLAERRGDDLLNKDVMKSDPERLMVATHEASRDYTARYEAAASALERCRRRRPNRR